LYGDDRAIQTCATLAGPVCSKIGSNAHFVEPIDVPR
jgi:hypothetical protein